MRKPLSQPLEDERPRLEVGFIANKKSSFRKRKLNLSNVEKKNDPPVKTEPEGSFFFVTPRRHVCEIFPRKGH
jgi:hypothetical protein